jgi:hypothetical protein
MPFTLNEDMICYNDLSGAKNRRLKRSPKPVRVPIEIANRQSLKQQKLAKRLNSEDVVK